MANLEIIKKRIQSIEVTSKITFAMKMVTTVKLQKYQKKYQIYQNYFAGLLNVFRATINNVDVDLNMVNRLFYRYNKINLENSTKILYVIFGSDLGMCGHYNSDLFKNLKNTINDATNAEFLIFGTRIARLISSQQPDWKIIKIIHHIDKELMNHELIFIRAFEVFDYFIKNNYQKIHFVYTQFINSLKLTIQSLQILPLTLEVYNRKDLFGAYLSEDNLGNYELGFKPESVVLALIPQLFTHLFYAVLIESKISEASSRYNAMTAATDNAKALLDEYKLEYNRTRQALITQEIIEIISGATKNHKK